MTTEFSAKRLLTPGEAAQLAHEVLMRAQLALHPGAAAAHAEALRSNRLFGPWLELGAIAVCGLIAAAGCLAQR